MPTNRRMAVERRQSEAGKAETQGDSESHDGSQAQVGPTPTPPLGGWLEILGARHNNLRNVDVAIPLGHVHGGHRA